jgi:hypothetical protein
MMADVATLLGSTSQITGGVVGLLVEEFVR